MNARTALLTLAALLVGCGTLATGQGEQARQVTLFGIIATPGGKEIDKRLSKVEPQLRKLLPNHSFRLLGVESRRLGVSETLTCDLGSGFSAEAGLLNALDATGKVGLRIALEENGAPLVITDVATPPNQLFFCDKRLPDGSKLVLGVGAR